MEDRVLVSVIIPVYNAEKFILETIQSVFNQTYPHIEIIVVDDASTDTSLAIINKFKNDNLKIIPQTTNKGASACRNIGLKNANGEFIQFLDADDILSENKIAEQVKIAENYGDNILIGCNWIRFKLNIQETIGSKHPPGINTYEIHDPINWLIKRPMMIPHTWLVSRKLIHEAGFWDESLSLNDDGEFFYRVIAKSSGIILSKDIVFYRSFQNSSLSSSSHKPAMISWIKSAETYEKVLSQYPSDASLEAIENLYFVIAFSCLNKFDDLVNICKTKLSKELIHYRTEIPLIENLKPILGLKSAKKIYTFIHFLKNNKSIRKAFGKK